MPNLTLQDVDRNHITTDATFRYRSGPESGTHIAALRKTLRNTGQLDRILVWQEVDEKGSPTNRLILLDGHYRVAAYRAEQSTGSISNQTIPALVMKGSRIDAHLAALTANSKDTLPLTAAERLNAAWSLVQFYGSDISKPKLARASGVSERTVLKMRQQIKKFTEAAEIPHGDWRLDRRFPSKGEYEHPSDGERQAMVADLSKAIKSAISDVRTHDIEIIADALQEALGMRRLAEVTDYLLGDTYQDRNVAWMEPCETEGGFLNNELNDF